MNYALDAELAPAIAALAEKAAGAPHPARGHWRGTRRGRRLHTWRGMLAGSLDLYNEVVS
jgi:hypothetical protein